MDFPVELAKSMLSHTEANKDSFRGPFPSSSSSRERWLAVVELIEDPEVAGGSSLA